MEYDRDTSGRKGSPDISQTIFDKIDKSVLFICDVSIINSNNNKRKMPNPNVLIELGYAVSKLGWERVICLFDGNTGKIEDLPFDIRQKRITYFYPEKGKIEEKRISDILSQNIKELFISGNLFNPLNDYMKGKIDKNLLDISKQISNMLYGTVSMSEGLSHVKDYLELESSMITKILQEAVFPGFIVFNNYNLTSMGLREILKELLSSSYFPREWTYTVLKVIDWIRNYEFFISKRNKNFPLCLVINEFNDNYIAVSAETINPTNPKNTFLILETHDKDGNKLAKTYGGRVLNSTQYPMDVREVNSLLNFYKIEQQQINNFSNLINSFGNICKQWLDITDSEFILDPDYYL